MPNQGISANADPHFEMDSGFCSWPETEGEEDPSSFMSASQNYMNFDVDLTWQELKMDGLFSFFLGEDM